jgi:hypothetical protein
MPGMKKTMGEFKKGTLHSGSKTGKKVTSRQQAIAIGMSEERNDAGGPEEAGEPKPKRVKVRRVK